MFRAWDKNHKCFWYELPIGFELKLDGKIFLYDMPTEEIILVRKTGLQDVNGKDIYEGDIVSFTAYDKPFAQNRKSKLINAIVIWLEGKDNSNQKKNPSFFNQYPSFDIKPIDENLYSKYSNCSWSPFHNCKVIGNIYENPELLEQGRVVIQESGYMSR